MTVWDSATALDSVAVTSRPWIVTGLPGTPLMMGEEPSLTGVAVTVNTLLDGFRPPVSRALSKVTVSAVPFTEARRNPGTSAGFATTCACAIRPIKPPALKV